MKKTIALILVLCTVIVLFSGCGKSAEDVIKDYSNGIIDLKYATENLTGTFNQTKDGVVLDSTQRTPSVTVSGFEADIVNKGILKITLKNTSDSKNLKVEFITKLDNKFGANKEKTIELKSGDKFEEYTVDMSDTYGYLYNLTGIRLTSDSISSGSIVVKKIEVCEGGEGYPEKLSFGAPEVYMDFRARAAKGIGYSPDGELGFWKDENGNLKVMSSLMGKLVLSTGTYDDPFKKVEYYRGEIEGVNTDLYSYASLAQIIKVPDSNILLGMTHLENHVGSSGSGVLGISKSVDGGQTWTFIGEIISHNLGLDVQSGYWRDIGNGITYMDDEYLYVYAIDWATGKNGLSISRAPLTELYAAVKEDKVPLFYKKFNGKWEEPGLGGNFDSVLPQKLGANFCQVVYNTAIKKYMMFTTAGFSSANNSDIALLISDSFDDFTKSEPFAIVPDMYGQQYPTVIGVEGSQTQVGEEFYLYYCHITQGYQGSIDWQLFWGSCEYRRIKITCNTK
ncbi:MAG: hypothetical protein E7480_01045 [Ruminococcaceae bacterium]|nr:hypothetical protein [Oscillospiraceae bacterium]